ncbi:MAG: DinB family protein, partial [Pseudomonadota bacterium]
MMAGDIELFAMPRAAFLRSVLFNHLYHHRGQLGVYLRLLG